MIRAAAAGLIAAVICIQLSKDNKEFAFLAALAAGLYILGYGILQLGEVITSINTIMEEVGLSNGYVNILLKCIGITYLGEFTSSLCKDAGHASIGEQIEMVAKLSILALSMPVLSALIETIYGM